MSQTLSNDEQSRYARHLLLPDVGLEGQKKLKAAKVLIIGLGGLGSPIALYLAAAGVGTLGLVDADIVDISNLQRQILYGTNDLGQTKAESAKRHLHETNPHVTCVLHKEKFSAENAQSLLKNYDLIIDGTDNFNAHYMINDACVLYNEPLIFGSVSRFDGMVGMVLPKKSACYRCLYPSPPPQDLIPNCAEAGVLGVVPGLIGMLQATEAIKCILGIGETLAGRIILADALKTEFKTIYVPRDTTCPICGDKPTMTTLNTPNASCQVANTDTSAVPTISANQLKKEMASDVPPFLLDVRNQDEFDERRIEGSHLIPLPVLEQRFFELNPDDDIVVHCKSGGRSARAIQFLQSKGFTKLRNLTGGITGY